MAGNVSGQTNHNQASSHRSRSTKTRGEHSNELQVNHSSGVRRRSPHGRHHGHASHHHAHSQHMEDIQKAELEARQEEDAKGTANGKERGRNRC